jgi:flagellar motor protein MotB
MCVLRLQRWKRLAAAPKTMRWRRQRLGRQRMGLRRRGGGGIKRRYADTTDHHHQEKGRPWRPSRRRVEGCLCRLCHRHDGAVHRVVAVEQQRARCRWRWAGTSRIRAELKADRIDRHGMAGSGENLLLTKQDMGKAQSGVAKSIQKMTDLDKLKKNIEMTVTAEGLRIELLESEKGTFFDSGSSSLNSSGKEMLTLLAAELGKFPTTSRWRDTPTPNLLPARPATATGNCRPTGRTRRGD